MKPAASLLLLALLAVAGRAQVSDPFAPLASNPVTSGIEFSPDRSCEGVAVAVQPVPDAVGGHVKDLGWLMAWWSQRLRQVFEREYARPAGATLRAGRDTLLVVTIAHPNAFAALREQAGRPDARDGLAFYAPQLPGIVLLDPGGESDASDRARLVRPLVHAATHALLDSWLPPDAPPPPTWFAEGLAERLGACTGQLREDEPAVEGSDTEGLRALAAAFVDRPARVAMLRPLPELLAVGSLADVVARAGEMGFPAHDALHGFAHESGLFFEWLDDGDRKQPDRVTPLVRAVLAGRPSAEALTAVLAGATPAAAEASFASWLDERISSNVGGSRAAGFTLQPPPLAAGEVQPGLRARPDALAVPAGDAARDRALALHAAASGDLRGAAQRLGELAAAPGLAAADASALQADQRRCLALDDLRHRWLLERVGKKVELRDGAALVKLTVMSADGGLLVVKDGARTRELPESACPLEALAAQLVSKGALPEPDDEARAFAWLLGADAALKDKTVPRMRKDAGVAAAALLDQRAEIEARLALGRALTQLAELAARELPTAGAADAARDEWLAVARVLGAARDVPAVAERLAVLRSLAGQVLAARFDEAPLRCAPPRGQLEELGGGRVRLTWDFSDAAQLQDWTSTPMPREEVDHLKALRGAPQPVSPSVSDRGLELLGSGVTRCAFAFAAPLAVEYSAMFSYTPDERAIYDASGEYKEPGLTQYFGLRLCSNGAGDFLECMGFGYLHARSATHEEDEWHQGGLASLLIDVSYDLRLEHDGETLRGRVEGRETGDVPAFGCTSGPIELWRYTERPVAVRRIAVEGALDPSGMGTRRDVWVGGQLGALGLGD